MTPGVTITRVQIYMYVKNNSANEEKYWMHTEAHEYIQKIKYKVCIIYLYRSEYILIQKNQILGGTCRGHSSVL